MSFFLPPLNTANSPWFQESPEKIRKITAIVERQEKNEAWSLLKNSLAEKSSIGRSFMLLIEHNGKLDLLKKAAYSERFEAELQILLESDDCLPLDQSRGLQYLTIAADLVASVESRGAMVGPGRARGPSSLIFHMLGLTKMDPIVHGFPLETVFRPGYDRHILPWAVQVDASSRAYEMIHEVLNMKYPGKVFSLGVPQVHSLRSALRGELELKKVPSKSLKAIMEKFDQESQLKSDRSPTFLSTLVYVSKELASVCREDEDLLRRVRGLVGQAIVSDGSRKNISKIPGSIFLVDNPEKLETADCGSIITRNMNDYPGLCFDFYKMPELDVIEGSYFSSLLFRSAAKAIWERGETNKEVLDHIQKTKGDGILNGDCILSYFLFSRLAGDYVLRSIDSLDDLNYVLNIMPRLHVSSKDHEWVDLTGFDADIVWAETVFLAVASILDLHGFEGRELANRFIRNVAVKKITPKFVEIQNALGEGKFQELMEIAEYGFGQRRSHALSYATVSYLQALKQVG